MENIKDFKKLQEILMNSWPAKHYYFLNGWILRFTDGVTSRANSVFPLTYRGDVNTLDTDIKFVEKAYQTYNLPTIFTIPEYFEPIGLDIKLLECGYHQAGDITNTMIASIQELKNELINDDFSYFFYLKRIERFSRFQAEFSKRNQYAQIILDALASRIIIPQKCFIITEHENNVVGTLMGVLDHHGFLYIADMLVNPDFRRRKIATSMLFKILNDWAKKYGAHYIWLQVESGNKEAMNLYKKLGFMKAYSYYYLEKPIES